MKDFSQYVFEKLNLSKVAKSKDNNISYFEKGEDITMIGLYLNNPWDNTVELEIYEPHTVMNFTDKEIIYKANNRDIKFEYYINSKGFCQHDISESKSGRIFHHYVFMHLEKCKEIIELLLKEKVFNPKYAESAKEKIIDILDKEYFDNLDMNEIKKRKLRFYDMTHAKSGVVMPFERPKELKEVISQYYNV